MIKKRSNVTRVEWAPSHFSWLLIDNSQISLKLEKIPPKGESELHFHQKSSQFFFILDGEAEFKREGSVLHLKKHQGIEVPSGKKHQILNPGNKNLLFLLLNYPKVQKDDIWKAT